MRLLGIFLVIFLVDLPLFAQTLQLFEDTERMSGESESNNFNQSRRDNEGNLITGPEFTLVGTSRIGGNRVIVLENRLGEIISLSLPEGSPKSVPGYPNYRVLEVGSGQASIEYPANLPCVEFLDRGIACESERLAVLSLQTASPIESSNQRESGNDSKGLADSGDANTTVNPFEALLERAANPSAEIGSDNTFTPRRINPEDVPPGMRVVSTPFGDRLVEIDQ